MAILTEIQNEDAATSTLYDVFLSFRGTDTRLSFIDHLYQALFNENISTFLDEEEVEGGEDLKPELERAIRNSRASIIVLSENYASSTWCLEELVMILKQRNTSNHIVLPIFFHVDPTHVRKQQNTFGKALAEHKKRMEAEKDEVKKSQRAHKLKLWTKALTEVADLKGKDAKGRRETVFIEEIVKEVSGRLKLHLRTNIPHLIGMEFSIKTISSWLMEESETFEILTIWGMAGIGKTSLARYIYRLHSQEFERSSFIEDIERRCAEQSNGPLDLQKQLLRDILKRSKIEERDSDVYTTMTRKTMFNKRTLVVLDGVDNFKQLDVLIGTKHLNPRCKIIITTKDCSVTEKCALFHQVKSPKHKKHELFCLSSSESLRLLCWHAFGSYGLKEGYEEQAKIVAMYCNGHPLALKVLGSSLRNEDVATWCDTCLMLERKEFPPDILKVLRISFDSLPENCKELFKHIACFFVGKERGETETILNECGICASSGITKLVERCLLTLEGKFLMMHQLLQEMGRDIVYQESPKKPWKRSRLWNHEDCLKLLKEEKGTTNIQGLVLDMKMKEKNQLHGSSNVGELKFQDDLYMNFRANPLVHRAFGFFSMIWWIFTWIFRIFSSTHQEKEKLRTNALNKMDNLHLLQLNYVKLNGSYENFPTSLRWLCMHGYQLEYIPSNLSMENLVALDLSHSNLKQLWKKPKLLGSLKILSLSYSKIVRVGGFLGLPALERLILTGCGSLNQVCKSIGQCDELVLLDIRYCETLKKLPKRIRTLKKLKGLLMDGCNIAVGEFPIESKASSSFVTKHVPENPRSLALLLPRSLVTLSLADNNIYNDTLPLDLSSLSVLKTLILSGNPIDSLPDCERSLKRLRRQHVERCSELKSVLCPQSTTKILLTTGYSIQRIIPFHPQMSKPPFVISWQSGCLLEVQDRIKIQALAEIHEDILSHLGWTDLQYVRKQELQILDYNRGDEVKKVPVQMCYEFGIFSTCFPGKEVPNWLANKSNGSSISHTMPSSPVNKRIRGLNIFSTHTFTGTRKKSYPKIKVRNMTKNQTWVYYAFMKAVQEADKDLAVLSHWMFENNEFEVGDEFSVTIVDGEDDGVKVRECAVSPMYGDGDKEEDPLGYYKSWKHIIGGDLSIFQLTTGDYFLIHDRFHFHSGGVKVLYNNPTTQKLFGYTPRFKEDEKCKQDLLEGREHGAFATHYISFVQGKRAFVMTEVIAKALKDIPKSHRNYPMLKDFMQGQNELPAIIATIIDILQGCFHNFTRLFNRV